MRVCKLLFGIVLIVLLAKVPVLGQKERTQYPPFLSNSFFSINLGYIQFPFSSDALTPGYTAENIKVYHTAIRVNLGHQFNKHLTAQISYMRPFEWVHYENINGDDSRHSVWMNLGTASLKYRQPVAKKFSVYAETGLAIVTRGGFKTDTYAVNDATYPTIMLGTGLHYHLSNNWDLLASFVYSPPNNKEFQPETYLLTGGFSYYFRPLSEEKVKKSNESPYIFQRNLFQIGYTTNALGFGPNRFFTHRRGYFGIPIFWEGNVYVQDGLTIAYQRNIFRGYKIFSFDLGGSFSYIRTEINHDKSIALSIYPVAKFWFLRTKGADFYACYSVPGPTFISRRYMDDLDTGGKFTFQDFMGIGGMVGQQRHLNFEIKIVHYSNGNVLPYNEGVAVPLTFCLGYAY